MPHWNSILNLSFYPLQANFILYHPAVRKIKTTPSPHAFRDQITNQTKPYRANACVAALDTPLQGYKTKAIVNSTQHDGRTAFQIKMLRPAERTKGGARPREQNDTQKGLDIGLTGVSVIYRC